MGSESSVSWEGRAILLQVQQGFLAKVTKGSKPKTETFLLVQVNWLFFLLGTLFDAQKKKLFDAVLIEKLLRASPEIGKIFILLKSKDEESANKRLYDEASWLNIYILSSLVSFLLSFFIYFVSLVFQKNIIYI